MKNASTTPGRLGRLTISLSEAWSAGHRVVSRFCPLVMTVFIASIDTLGQPSTEAGEKSVMVTAVASSAPVKITLSWSNWSGTTPIEYHIYRKLRTGTSWAFLHDTNNGSTTTWVDGDLSPSPPSLNTLYEYKVVRVMTNSSDNGYGYAACGIEVKPDVILSSANHFSGTIVLLVDETFSTTLTTELAQLERDLKSDGWKIIRHDVDRDTDVDENGTPCDPDPIRDLVQADYAADPNVKAVYIVGHVPVPYSGIAINPDGHHDHRGAWPCDGYYGEMDGTWDISSTTTSYSQNYRNNHLSGDFKYDEDVFPSLVELQVGRVDMSDMPAFSQSEAQLLSSYLTKAHAFKVAQLIPQFRGVVYDNFIDFDIAANGYRNVGSLVGPVNYVNLAPGADVEGLRKFENYINGQSHLWTFACGGGQWDNATQVGTTQHYASTVSMGGAFNMVMGSYFGDWNTRNNFVRAAIASGAGLTNVWAGLPSWWFHTMGMGENIGSCVRMTMNNEILGTLYSPLADYDDNGTPPLDPWNVHAGLMGDPTLRMVMLAPPSNLTVSNVGGFANFNWTGSTEAVDGYYIYKFVNGVPEILTTTPVLGTTHTSSMELYDCSKEYMVRAVKLYTSATGSYHNLSLGALSSGAGGSVQISVKVFLDGPYVADAMSDGLRSGGYVPLSEPYSGLGFAQGGGGCETTSAAVLSANSTNTNAIVDWIRVELRSVGAPSTIVASRQGLLQKDGDIVSTDGTSPLILNVPAGSYHVAVRHRNHLGVMTLNAVALSGVTTTVDFTVPTTDTYGTDARKTVGMKRTLWSGNVNRLPPSQLQYVGSGNDRDPILLRVGSTTPNNSVTGYWLEDVTMDGTVKYIGSGNDRDPILVNVGGTTPNSVRLEQLP